MTFPKKSEHEIQGIVLKYEYNIRSLVRVLRSSPGFLEGDIASKISPLGTLTLNDLIKHDAESAGNMFHTLILSRCLEQPQPGPRAYVNSDVLNSVVASHAVWTTLVSRRGRKVYSEHANMLDLFRRVPEMAPSAGWLWEYLCHGSISSGGNFSLTEMTEEPGALVPSSWVLEEEVIYIGQGYRYALRDQDAFCLAMQDSLQVKK